MDIRTIKNDKNYFWTNHSKYKLLQYNLSPSFIKRIIRYPERKEEGIAPNTIAVMRRKDGKKTKREVWVMYQKNIKNKKKIHPVEYPAKAGCRFAVFHRVKIISAWVYPGVSPKGKAISIPEDVWEEINNNA